MKKSLAVILIAALAISLTACGEAEMQAPAETTVSEETVTESVEVTTEVEEAEEPELGLAGGLLLRRYRLEIKQA